MSVGITAVFAALLTPVKADNLAVGSLPCRDFLNDVPNFLGYGEKYFGPVVDYIYEIDPSGRGFGNGVNNYNYVQLECRLHEHYTIETAVRSLFNQRAHDHLPDIPIGGATSDPHDLAQRYAFQLWVHHKGPRPTFSVAAAPPVSPPPAPVDTSPKVEAPRPVPETPVPAKVSIGTGFFVSATGHILTNAHVVDGCDSARISSPNGAVSSRIIARDIRNDLALLKADLAPSKIAGLRTGARLGEQVAAFGYPLRGLLSTSGNFTVGNVTALTGIGDDTRYLQVSVPVQPGNSGGPLLDASGNLVGVVSAKLNALNVMVATQGDIPQNVNFAIKGSVAAIFLESNGVSFATGTATAAMAPADLATLAQSLSVLIQCKRSPPN
jgi:S1-C subfamily serine protease